MRFQHLVCLLLASLDLRPNYCADYSAHRRNPRRNRALPPRPTKPRSKNWARRCGHHPEGILLGRQSEGRRCKTTITKAQFEKLADTLQPGNVAGDSPTLATGMGGF